MTDHQGHQHGPAVTAAVDQLEAAAADLSRYIYALSPEDLLAELRCTLGRLCHATSEGPGGPMHPLAVTAHG